MDTNPEWVHELLITTTSEAESDICIALLNSMGVEAVEQRTNAVIVYHPDHEYLRNLQDGLLHDFPSLRSSHFHYSKRKNENWNELWEKSFKPIIVPGFCTIKSDFHKIPILTPHSITINPEMAFGTGHHETTYNMMVAMQDISFEKAKVLDFGTGTGILAILAEILGAEEILAIDNDPIAIECANKCFDQNNCSNIGGLVSGIENISSDKQFQIILANINRNVLIADAEHIRRLHEPGGQLILSGILMEDEGHVSEAYSQLGYQRQSLITDNGWSCMTFLRL